MPETRVPGDRQGGEPPSAIAMRWQPRGPPARCHGGDGSFTWSSGLRASFAGHSPGRPRGIERVKPSAVHVGASRRPGSHGENAVGASSTRARRLHAGRNSPAVAAGNGRGLGGPLREREEGRGPRPAGNRELDRVTPARRVSAETNRRHLASNKLARRTSKKVAGACERWPSWSLFSGATWSESPAKGCPEALSVANVPRGEQRFRASVTSTGWRSAHRKVGRSRAPRGVSLSRVGR